MTATTSLAVIEKEMSKKFLHQVLIFNKTKGSQY